MSTDNLSFTVRERLQYIEFLLQFRGWLARVDLIDKFSVSAPAATRDFRKYKDLAPNNIDFDDRYKRYKINESSFEAIFPLRINEAMGKLRSPIISEALGLGQNDSFTTPPRLSVPKLDVLMWISRAILNFSAVEISYLSVKSGESKRVIAPHSLIDNGLRLHVRAYDFKRAKFSDFVLGRITSVTFSNEPVTAALTREKDHQWNRFIRLELVPHPKKHNVENQRTIEHDFDMVNGSKVIQVRAAIAGYWLRLWNVDCTIDASLIGNEYQLWLKNNETLYDVESAFITPHLKPNYPTPKS